MREYTPPLITFSGGLFVVSGSSAADFGCPGTNRVVAGMSTDLKLKGNAYVSSNLIHPKPQALQICWKSAQSCRDAR